MRVLSALVQCSQDLARAKAGEFALRQKAPIMKTGCLADHTRLRKCRVAAFSSARQVERAFACITATAACNALLQYHHSNRDTARGKSLRPGKPQQASTLWEIKLIQSQKSSGSDALKPWGGSGSGTEQIAHVRARWELARAGAKDRPSFIQSCLGLRGTMACHP